MRVLVCGGHKVINGQIAICRDLLDRMHAATPITCIIHGNADGWDSAADKWAILRGIPVDRYIAEWGKHRKAAGPIRNQRMIDEGRPDEAIAFPGGKGTADMTMRLFKAGIRTTIPHDLDPVKGSGSEWLFTRF